MTKHANIHGKEDERQKEKKKGFVMEKSESCSWTICTSWASEWRGSRSKNHKKDHEVEHEGEADRGRSRCQNKGEKYEYK